MDDTVEIGFFTEDMVRGVLSTMGGVYPGDLDDELHSALRDSYPHHVDGRGLIPKICSEYRRNKCQLGDGSLEACSAFFDVRLTTPLYDPDGASYDVMSEPYLSSPVARFVNFVRFQELGELTPLQIVHASFDFLHLNDESLRPHPEVLKFFEALRLEIDRKFPDATVKKGVLW